MPTVSKKKIAPSIRRETITPEKAARWMDGAINVRPIRKHRVAMWQEKIRREIFGLSNDAICLDANDKLINGWHRMSALVEEGKTNTGVRVEAFVARNMDEASTNLMDKGLKRSISDGLLTKEYRSIVAGASRLYLTWVHGVTHNSHKAAVLVPDEDILEFANANLQEFTNAARNGWNVYKSIGGTPTAWSTFFFEAGRIDPDLTAEFYDAVLTGASLDQGDPRLAVRNWFVNQITTARRQSSIPNANALHIMAQGWNAWIRGDVRDRLHLPRKNAKDVRLPRLVTPDGETVPYNEVV